MSRVVWLIVASCLAANQLLAAEKGVAVQLSSFDREDYRGEVRLLVGTRPWAMFKYVGSETKLESTEVVLPDGTREISYSGKLEWTHYRAGKQTSQGDNRHSIVDFTELMQPLRNRQLNWSDRLKQFEKAQEAFESKYKELGAEADPRVETGNRATASQINAAEKRLGYPLPPQHAKLLVDVGGWTINDSSLTSAQDLQAAFRQMIQLWETPAAEMNRLPAKTQQFYQQTVILFTEVGDGYSALVCQPLKDERGTTTHRFYWVTQDEITTPELLADRDGTPFDYLDAMCWLIANQLVRTYEDIGTGAIFVDFRAPVPLYYDVQPQFASPKTLQIRLLLDWKHFR
jgi:hypothetical protein